MTHDDLIRKAAINVAAIFTKRGAYVMNYSPTKLNMASQPCLNSSFLSSFLKPYLGRFSLAFTKSPRLSTFSFRKITPLSLRNPKTYRPCLSVSRCIAAKAFSIFASILSTYLSWFGWNASTHKKITTINCAQESR